MKYKLQDLIDIEHFQSLQDRLNEICSFPSAIIDNNGNILTATAWQAICTKFHRKNKDCEKLCIKSDQYIKDHILEANPAVSHRCPHGLVDNATPIIIDGYHYGNFFTGQFFLEKPDIQFFRAQAQKYGFDEDAYLKAVKNVPIWTQEKLESYLFFIKELIAVISESGLKMLKEIENREQIETTEKRHKSILKTAMDGYWLTDNEGRLLEVNNAYCSMSGYSEDELLTMCISDLEIEENFQLVAQNMQKDISQGSDRFESKHLRKDGSGFDVEVSVQFRNEDGSQCVFFLRDITDRKLTENNLKENLSFLQTLIDTIPIPLFYKDVKGEYLSVNAAFEEFYGKNREDIIGKTVYDFGPKHIADKYYKKDQELFRCQGVQVYEWKVINAAGETREVIFNKASYTDSKGKINGLIGTISDITDRKRIEAELRISEERYRRLTENAKDMIYRMSLPDGKYEYVSPAAENIFGYPPKYFYKSPLLIKDAIHPNWRDFFANQWELLLAGDMSQIYEYQIIHKSGEERWLNQRNVLIKDKSGLPVAIEAIVTDVTERKKAEEETAKLERQLQQAQKMESVGRLAGGVAHDFNNMLGVILGHAELAMYELDRDHPIYNDLQQIQQAANRSSDITRQLLAFARQQIVTLKVIDLNETVAGMLKMLLRLIGEDINLAWLPGNRLWPIKIDPSQIDQILANLCVNARDAIADVGKITVETGNCTVDEEYCLAHEGFVSGEYVKLNVSDNGSGMDKDTLSHIFEPFFTTKGVNEGTGLGLATIYGIVKQNNGFVYVRSEQGQGATFSIYLPRYMGTTNTKDREFTMEPVIRGNETILLVEDEPSILNITATMLQRLGYTVLKANTPNEAIRLAGQHSGEIHLVLTDVIMPEMNGRIMTEKLMANRPKLKRLFMSGYTADVISHHGVLDDGVNFIQKPFATRELATKIRQALGNG